MSQPYVVPKLTPESIPYFTEHLRRGPKGPLAVELRSHIHESVPYQQLCLGYVIGSASINGQVDDKALETIYCLGLYKDNHLRDLLDALFIENGFRTVVEFTCVNIKCGVASNGFRDLLLGVIGKHWDLVAELTMQIVARLKEDVLRQDEYRLMLRSLPTAWKYELIVIPRISLFIIDDVYSLCESDPLLRELLASRPYPVCLSLRDSDCINDKTPNFDRFCADRPKNYKIGRDGKIPELSAELWHHIFGFMDGKELFVLQFVCRSWKTSYLHLLEHDVRIYCFYLRQIQEVGMYAVSALAPWRYVLRSKARALEYFRLCLISSAVNEIVPNERLGFEAKRYLKAVIANEVPLVKDQGCGPSYGPFLRLFEGVHKLCPYDMPILDRPHALPDDDYCKVVHYLVCEKRLTGKLSRSWIAGNMQKLFELLEGNEKLMKDVISWNFNDFVRPSIILVLYGQSNNASKELRKLIFSQTDLFREFIEQDFAQPVDCYRYIVESCLLPKLMPTCYWMAEFNQLMICTVLLLKSSSVDLDKIVASIVHELSNNAVLDLSFIESSLVTESSKILGASSEYSPEDIALFKSIMARCGFETFRTLQ